MRTGLTAGVVEAIEEANQQRVYPEDIPDLLAAMRAGDELARQVLSNGTKYLIYEAAQPDTGRFRADRLGSLYIAHHDAISRLTVNDKLDALAYIADALHRGTRRQSRDESQNILVDPSTNCKRRKRGKQPYQSLRRMMLPDANPIDEVAAPVQPPADDLRGSLCRDEEERDVIAMLESGHSYLTIAASLGITKHRVATIVDVLRSRAERLGYVLPTPHKPTRPRPNMAKIEPKTQPTRPTLATSSSPLVKSP